MFFIYTQFTDVLGDTYTVKVKALLPFMAAKKALTSLMRCLYTKDECVGVLFRVAVICYF
jgi:hypothetical protein